MEDIITLDVGSGGRKTAQLIEELLVPAFNNPQLNALGDGAILSGGFDPVFSTDSFVVSPLFFPGGNIGKLAVCGTVNDVAMCGGTPRYLSCAFIIEEGLPTETLKKIVASMAEWSEKAGVSIVTGDTKVVEHGRGDGIYINTAGIGALKYPGLSPHNIQAGDAVLVSGTVGDHGTAVMLARTKMFQSEIASDCAPLAKLADAILQTGCVRVLRDPTRGGVATTLNEFTEDTALGIELQESAVPVRKDVTAACELLGLDPLYSANEGKLLAIVPQDRVDEVLEIMKRFPEGENAAQIGNVTAAYPGRVVMQTESGGKRILQKLSGAQLPRIC